MMKILFFFHVKDYRYMAEILLIRDKALFKQSIIQTKDKVIHFQI